MAQAGYLDILDSAPVTKNSDGKFDHHGERHPVSAGAIYSAIIGGLTAVVFAILVLGLAAGTALGSNFGMLAKSGASDDFHGFRDQVANDYSQGARRF